MAKTIRLNLSKTRFHKCITLLLRLTKKAKAVIDYPSEDRDIREEELAEAWMNLKRLEDCLIQLRSTYKDD